MQKRRSFLNQVKSNSQVMVRLAVIVILAALAFSTRLLPLSISPYPYHNDGITECRIASDILESGDISYPEGSFYVNTHSEITPVYNVFLAFIGSMVGATPFQIAQFAVAAISVMTIVGVYVLAQLMTDSRKGAIAAAMFLSLFGTFVYLTGSTWKESLGLALIVLMVFSYIHRDDKRMFILMMVVMLTMPFVHHLVTIVAYLMMAYMTAWSWFFALRNGSLRKRHYVDLLSIVVLSLVAIAYYRASSLDRFSEVVEEQSIFPMMFAFLLLLAATILLLSRQPKLRVTLAPLPVAMLALFVFWNHFVAPFEYMPGTSDFIIILLLSSCLLVGISWFGFERFLRSKSVYRTIPIGLLLPVVSLVLYALIKGFETASHQILYRTFDFADLALAIGIAATVGHFAVRPKVEKAVVAAILVAAIISFPFGYYTASLIGVRHDTQGYEYDAIEWLGDEFPSSRKIHSDERLAYNLRALNDFDKMPYLPSTLYNMEPLSRTALNLYEEEWTSVGTNDYPYGHPVLDAAYVSSVMDVANVFYVGGPASNSVVVFMYSGLGASCADW